MHLPVLLPETIDNLISNPKGTYVDCTLGGGGHMQLLLDRLSPEAKVIGLDKDSEVLEQTSRLIKDQRVVLRQSDFRYLAQVLKGLEIDLVDGIMMDLGVSSFQLDQPERGFSFHSDAPLDMRMNRNQPLTARDIVNNYSESELSHIFYTYGEEAYARSISRAIVSYRQTKPIETTLELTEIIKSAVPAKYRREKHPARKSFQALRIEVNEELKALEEVLPQAVSLLKPGGRLCIISFHSLEDRIVKQFLAEKSLDCICPSSFPICICDHRAQVKLVNRKPITASAQECAVNPRARSARLRVAVKI